MTTKPGKSKVKKPAAKRDAAGFAARPKKPLQKHKKTVSHAYDREPAIEAVLAELAAGHSLVSICRREGFPAYTTFMRWLAEEGAEGDALRDNYARAREVQAEVMAEDILAIADEQHLITETDETGAVEVKFDSVAVQRNRLRVDARRWLLSKMAPKKYGDKTETAITGADGAPLSLSVQFVRPGGGDAP